MEKFIALVNELSGDMTYEEKIQILLKITE